MTLARLLELIGVDWIPYILKGTNPSIPIEPESLSSLKGLFRTYPDDVLLETLASCQELFRETEDRIGRIEGKATSLIGFAGAGLALSVTVAANLLDPKQSLAPAAHIVLVLLLFLTAASFIVTLVLLSRVLNVFRYTHVAPDRGSATELRELRVERAASLCYGQLCNDNVAREKATHLGGGQLWFRNGILALFVLLAGYFIPASGDPAAPPSRSPRLVHGPSLQTAPPSSLPASPQALPTGKVPMVPAKLPTRTATLVTLPTPAALPALPYPTLLTRPTPVALPAH